MAQKMPSQQHTGRHLGSTNRLAGAALVALLLVAASQSVAAQQVTVRGLLSLRNNNYCSDQLDRFRCNIPAAGTWELMTWNFRDVNNEVAWILSPRTGRYCSDQPLKFTCNIKVPGPWETFKIIKNGDGSISLRSGRTSKYCRNSAADSAFTCNSPTIGAAEKFATVANALPQNISLRSGRTGQYCTDSPDRFRCDKNYLTVWEKFQVTYVGQDLVTLRSGRTSRLCSEQPAAFKCDTTIANASAVFEVLVSGGSATFFNGRTKQSCVDRPDAFRCDGNAFAPGPWQRFQFADVGKRMRNRIRKSLLPPGTNLTAAAAVALPWEVARRSPWALAALIPDSSTAGTEEGETFTATGSITSAPASAPPGQQTSGSNSTDSSSSSTFVMSLGN